MSHRSAGLIFALGLSSCFGSLIPGSFQAADDDRERPVMERFLAVLEKAPRRGTALDRVYGFQLGETEEGLNALRRAVRANKADVPAITNLAERPWPASSARKKRSSFTGRRSRSPGIWMSGSARLPD